MDGAILQAIVDRVGEVALVIGEGGEVALRNAAASRLLGEGDPWPRLGAALRERAAAAARGLNAFEVDGECDRDGAGRVRLVWRGEPLGAGRLLLLGRDVTAERAALRARADAEQRFDLVSRAARDLIYDFDVVADTITWGHNAWEVFGLAREDLGTTLAQWASRIHPDDAPATVRKLAEALARGVTYDDEYRFRRGDGSWAVCRDRGLVVKAPDGRVVRMIGGMEEVTEQRRAHAELAASEARYRFIAETTSDLVYDYDVRADRFDFISPRVESWLGVARERLLAEPGLWWRLIDPEDRDRVRASVLADTVERRTRTRHEFRLRTAAGKQLTVADVGAVTYDSLGPVRILGTVSDVGEQRKLEAELTQAQKLESIGRLAGGIAHDFNNLLTGIQANLDLARRSLELGAPALEHLGEMERTVDRAAELVRGLLVYSRRAPLSLAALDVARSVRAVVRLLKPVLDPRIVVEVEVDPRLPPAWADGARLEQALVNLALNARDAMPDGGRLRFHLDLVRATSPPGKLALDSAEGHEERTRMIAMDYPRDYVRIAVEDTGVGMSPEVRARCFEPFFTTKGPDRGTGLGLPIVLGIVQQHDGWLECTSEPGRGSKFTVHLPRCTQVPAPRPEGPAAQPVRGSETLLLADDELPIRKAMRALLESLGYSVLLAGDGQEAVDIYAREHARVRAVILDLTMPRLSGREALEALRTVDPAVRVIISSGYSLDEVSELPGVAAVLVKPYQVEQLARVVREVIDGPAR